MTDIDIASEGAREHKEVRRPPRSSVPVMSTRWVVTIVLLVLIAMFVHLLVTSPNIEWHVVSHYFLSSLVLKGLGTTIELTALGMAIGIVLGIVLALTRMSRSRLLWWVATIYIWFFRGTPLLVQIIFWFNLAAFVPRVSIGVPFGPSFASVNTNSVVSSTVAAVLALGLNEAAYMSEIVRAGILSVDAGQMEAARAVGMTRGRAMRRVVLPQAMRFIIPPTGNQAIGLLKGSSLVSVISTTELLYSVELIYSQTFQTIPLLIVASIWYLIVTTVLSVGQYYIERHFGRGAAGASRSVRPARRLIDKLSLFVAAYRPGLGDEGQS